MQSDFAPIQNQQNKPEDSNQNIFSMRKGYILSERKFQKYECQKKAVFIAFTALLPHSHILPPQKIDPLFIRILLSHKGRTEKENSLIAHLTTLANSEKAKKISNEELTQMYINISHIAKDCVDNDKDYSKASIVVDAVTQICKLSDKEVPEALVLYLEKAALFFIQKEDEILNYIKDRQMIHPSIVKRSLEYARLALDISEHYAKQAHHVEILDTIKERYKELNAFVEQYNKKRKEKE